MSALELLFDTPDQLLAQTIDRRCLGDEHDYAAAYARARQMLVTIARAHRLTDKRLQVVESRQRELEAVAEYRALAERDATRWRENDRVVDEQMRTER